MGKTLQSESATIHVILECTDCGWRTQDYIRGEEAAAEHALKNGHMVKGELGVAVTYKGGR